MLVFYLPKMGPLQRRGDGWHVGNGAAVPCCCRPQLGVQQIPILELGMRQRDLYFHLELYLKVKKKYPKTLYFIMQKRFLQFP